MLKNQSIQNQYNMQYKSEVSKHARTKASNQFWFTHYKTFTLSTLALSSENAKWKSFWDSFKSAIHENNRMSKIDIQLNYLNSLLEASASRSIQGPVSSPIPTTIQRLKFSRKIRQISTNNLDTY